MRQLNLKCTEIPEEPELMEVRGKDSFSAHEEKLLEFSKLGEIGECEAWTVKGTNNELSYSTHGIFRYFGKFPPPVATHLINAHTKEGDLVCDPTCGSGTTGVECLHLNRKCLLTDVNPLSLLLSRVKTKKIAASRLTSVLDRIIIQYRPLTVAQYKFEPIGLRNYSHWFLEQTTNSLRGLLSCINEESNNDLREFFLASFASTIRKVSRATSQQGRLFLDVETAEEDALKSFIKRTRKAIQAVGDLPEGHARIDIRYHNLLETFPTTDQNKANLVIIHPPYFNAYKYSGINSLELSWLGHVHGEIRKNEIREYFKVGKADNVHSYVNDMVDCLKNSFKLALPGSVIGLMIGDTVIKNEYIPATRMILDKVKDDVIVEKIALRVPKYTEATWVASQRREAGSIGIKLYDFVITLRKKR